MIEPPHLFDNELINWYLLNKRDLPWRDTVDAYKIWISEIILQQTRVAQGLDYYNRFVERFPTLSDLASAAEDEVLRLWQGLGYYSRARNMHAAAKEVVERFGGVFPSTYNEVRLLKGIGDYTAAAIASFSQNEPYAVVDGNVYRVLSRLFGIDMPIDSTAGKRYFARLAQQLLPEDRAGLYNQALMEFGALQCVQGMPDCGGCILNNRCEAFAADRVSALPVKTKKTKRRDRFFSYLRIRFGNSVYLQQRVGRDIWKGLFQFPLIEADRLLELDDLFHSPIFRLAVKENDYKIHGFSEVYKHVLSHQTLYARFVNIEVSAPVLLPGCVLVKQSELDSYALPQLIVRYLSES